MNIKKLLKWYANMGSPAALANYQNNQQLFLLMSTTIESYFFQVAPAQLLPFEQPDEHQLISNV